MFLYPLSHKANVVRPAPQPISSIFADLLFLVYQFIRFSSDAHNPIVDVSE
jgi:hypothetical protein